MPKPAVVAYPSAGISGEVRHKPARRGPSAAAQDLRRLAELLATLGLTGPSEACANLARADELRQASREQRGPDAQRAAIRADLAAGTLDPDQAESKLAALTDPQQAERGEHERRTTLAAAADQAAAAGVRSIHDAGEDAWLAPLRERAQQALDYRDEHTWQTVVALAAHLRSLGGLSSAVGADWKAHTFRRPELVHDHLVANAAKIRESATYVDDGTFVHYHPDGAPRLTAALVADHPEWEPGVLTGHEVVANVRAVVDREHAALRGEPVNA